MTGASRAVERHVRRHFGGHVVEHVAYDEGPIRKRVPHFAALRVAPGPSCPHWSYVSVGCWDAAHFPDHRHGTEFVLAAPTADIRFVELLAMNAYYHCGPPEQRLSTGHIVPLGESWYDGSACDHWLVSLPYPYGPEFETCRWPKGHAQILWLLPISSSEAAIRRELGTEALEQAFEDAAIDYTSPNRRVLSLSDMRPQ